MTTTSFHHSIDDKTPTADLRRDGDGDIWIKFTEGTYNTEIDIVMNPVQFLAFVSKCEDMRNGIELAQAAEVFNAS